MEFVWWKRNERTLDREERKKEQRRKLITAQKKGTLIFGFAYFEDRH